MALITEVSCEGETFYNKTNKSITCGFFREILVWVWLQLNCYFRETKQAIALILAV